jgi:predicted amidophosphoribosyltransferase
VRHEVRGDHRFCVDCWGSLDFIGAPWCATCCQPFEIDRGPDAQCAACLASPPIQAGARAVLAYCPALAGRCRFTGAGAAPSLADLGKGFIQAALIADALSRSNGIAHDPLLLRRSKRPPALRGMNPRQRAQTVRAARERRVACVEG